jgi:glutathione-regulated potassium-efflux system protein KefB
VAVKAALIFLLALLFGLERRPAFALGLLLSQGGEFGFVLFGQAAAAQLIAPEAASLFSAIVTLSMVTTPFLMKVATRFNRPKEEAVRDDLDGPDKAEQAAGIVVGYGRFGQTVAQMMSGAGFTVTIIDSDAEMIDVAAKFGAKVYYGDGTRLDLLKQAGGYEARIIVFAMDKDQLSREELELALKTFRQAAVFVRAYDRRTLMRYRGLDTAAVIREVFESAVTMGRKVLKTLGVEDERIARIETAYRARDKERLRIQAEKGFDAPEVRSQFSPTRLLLEEDQ